MKTLKFPLQTFLPVIIHCAMFILCLYGLLALTALPVLAATRDPFKPALTNNQEPLQGFSITTLKLVGTLRDNNRLWAIVQVPNGRTYRVNRGAAVGPSGSKITEIQNNSVQITDINKQVVYLIMHN